MPATAGRLRHFTESVVRGMTRLANEHRAVNLAQGFPDFDPPEALLSALEKGLRGPVPKQSEACFSGLGTPDSRSSVG